MDTITKALLIPINSEKKVLIQDRENYKPPRYGFFGGSVEEGETNTDAVIREAKEELGIDVLESELTPLRSYEMKHNNRLKYTQTFLYLKDIDVDKLQVSEGKGATFMSIEDALKILQKHASATDVKIIGDVRDYLSDLN